MIIAILHWLLMNYFFPFTNTAFFLSLPKKTMQVSINAEIRKGKYRTLRSSDVMMQRPALPVYPDGHEPIHEELNRNKLTPQVRH